MLSGVWFLSVFTVAGILQTESRKTAKDICKIRCLCEEKENVLNINCENKGFTTVSDIGYIYRGYEQFEQKLKQLGGEIQLVNNEKEVAKFKLKIG